MLRRQFEFGETRTVEVLEVVRDRGKVVLLCGDVSDGPGREGYICFYEQAHPTVQTVVKGDKGTLMFTRGGPEGGYWEWRPTAAEGADNGN